MKQPGIVLLIVFAAAGFNNIIIDYASINKLNMEQTIAKKDEEILSDLNAQFIRNFINQDTASHNKIVHKDFVCIYSSGAIIDRDTYMKDWSHGYETSKYTSFTYTDESIRVFGYMALVRSKTVYTKTIDGQTVRGNTVYTDTYIKENGRWWCVQAQLTPVSKL